MLKWIHSSRPRKVIHSHVSIRSSCFLLQASGRNMGWILNWLRISISHHRFPNLREIMSQDVFQCQATQNVTKNSNFYVCPTWRTFLRNFYYVETLRRTILFTPQEQKNRVAFEQPSSPWRFWSQIHNNQTIVDLEEIL